MHRAIHRVLALLTAAAVGVAAPLAAQEAGEAEERGLTSPDVQQSQQQVPTDQGTRPPDTLDEEEAPRLYELLAQVRRAPPTLGGDEVTPRPNDFASEPAKEMPPEQDEDFYLFPEDYVE